MGAALPEIPSLDMPATVNIRNINEHAKTIAAFICETDTDAIGINIENCSDVDLSFLQLIESARILAKNTGKDLRLSSPASGAVLSTLKRAGLLDGPSREDAAFWLHHEVME